MRPEIVPLHPPKVTVGRPPPDELSDGVVRLRIPTHLDIDRIVHYGSDPSRLEGFWVPGPLPGQELHEWGSTFIQELIAGWTPVGGVHGGGLVIDEREPFLGILYLASTNAKVVSLSYGVAPQARQRGIASRAVRLATAWALTQGGFYQVELQIAKSQHESQHVAEKAGFHFVERFLTHVERTGETFEDLLYICTRSDIKE